MSGPKCGIFDLDLSIMEIFDQQYEQDKERQIQQLEQKRAEERQRRCAEAEKKREEERRRREERELQEKERKRNEEEERESLNSEFERIREQQLDYEPETSAEEQIDSGIYERFEHAYDEYAAACMVSGMTPEKYAYDESTAEQTSAELEELAVKIRAEAMDKMKNNYIHKCMNDALSEAGCELIAEKGTGTKISVYDFGENTAVCVTQSEDRVVMEVVGLGNEKEKLSASECVRLKGKMDSFCEKYRDIEAGLEKMGVKRKKMIYHYPADVKLARTLDISGLEKKGKLKKVRTESDTSENYEYDIKECRNKYD